MNRISINKGASVAGVFLSGTYLLCVILDFLFPSMAMYTVWQRLLPGLAWLTVTSCVLGLVDSFLYGVLFAIVFVPIHNWIDGIFPEEHAT